MSGLSGGLTRSGTFRDGQFVITSLAPDVCLTPVGPNIVPIPHAMDAGPCASSEPSHDHSGYLNIIFSSF